jgi:hypothetical protein
MPLGLQANNETNKIPKNSTEICLKTLKKINFNPFFKTKAKPETEKKPQKLETFGERLEKIPVVINKPASL